MSKAVKIKYYYDFVSPSEIFGFTVGTITLLGAMAIIIASAFSPWSASGITGCISLVITSVMMIGWAFSEQTWRRKMAAKNREITEKGVKVIGEIKNLKVIKVGEEFTYDVEYGQIDNTQITHIVTPRVISENMRITEKDLPLKVEVYIYKGEAFVDAIIDPPEKIIYHRMTRRVIYKYWPIPFAIISLTIGAILGVNGLGKVSAVVCFSTLLICGIYYYFIQDIFKK